MTFRVFILKGSACFREKATSVLSRCRTGSSLGILRAERYDGIAAFVGCCQMLTLLLMLLWLGRLPEASSAAVRCTGPSFGVLRGARYDGFGALVVAV